LVTPGETCGNLYPSCVGIDKTKQHTTGKINWSATNLLTTPNLL
jgi:hypothetical protein